MNSSPPKPEVIFTNFFAEPTVLLVPITSRDFAGPEKLVSCLVYIDQLQIVDIKRNIVLYLVINKLCLQRSSVVTIAEWLDGSFESQSRL